MSSYDYTKFRYLYPPRPETKAPVDMIQTLEDMGFIAQPKLNGSCALLFTDGKEVIFWNRHKKAFAKHQMDIDELRSLHRGKGWMVLVGEYMNKSQKDAAGKTFNHKFVLFDIIVFNGMQLIGKTTEDRLALMNSLWSFKNHDEWITQVTSNVFIVNSITTGFEDAWNRITEIGMYEGFVFKKPNAKLETGYREVNNSLWQVKIRRPTKNYVY
jgi:hypothetical protein